MLLGRWAYYNEFDLKAASWLRKLIKAGLIADGEVDTRSIADVVGADVAAFAQVHLFAGIGGWSYSLRQAKWPDDRPVWTGSCPCQPFSCAGAQKGFSDPRHLWPHFLRLITIGRPASIFGEQVASATKWLGLVRSDLEALDYAVGAIPIQAASAGAYHLRDRFWFVADSKGERRYGRQDTPRSHRRSSLKAGAMADTDGTRSQGWRELWDHASERSAGARSLAHDSSIRRGERRSKSEVQQRERTATSSDSGTEWIIGYDGKARRVEPGVCLLAHGFPSRVGILRGFGNAIDPRPASAFIKAYMDVA